MPDDKEKLRNALRAFNWYVHTYVPAFLRLANLEQHAQKLEKFREISDPGRSVDVDVFSRDIREDMKRRQKELRSGFTSTTEHVWPLIAEAIFSAKTPVGPIIQDRPLGMHAVASELSTIADRAGKIAVATGSATVEKVATVERALEQQLKALLNSAD